LLDSLLQEPNTADSSSPVFTSEISLQLSGSVVVAA